MKKILLTLLLIPALTALKAQDSVLHRIILIGDAGEMDPQQRNVILDAAAKVIPHRTSSFFLGDNIYPRGMGLPGSPEEKETQAILKSQYQPLRKAGSPVFFIPGNHDWDRMGPKGLAKIRQQSDFLAAQQDSLLEMIPKGGCPGPVEINLTPDLTVIAFDSEWWVYTYDIGDKSGECDCNTKDEIVDKLEQLFYKNRDKVIILASHHPFKTYGTHGGYFSLKDHLFPLTAANKNLYIPLPVLGSLYPFLRNTFTNPEDLKHPLYQNMIKRVDGVFKGFPNLIRVAGHDHGLQLIKGEHLQVVSGAGAKNSYARKGKDALFADATQGYVTADLMADRSVRLTYYIESEQGVQPVFSYTQPYTSFSRLREQSYAPLSGDSVTVAVHPSYDQVSSFHRKLFGENYRKEWAAPTRLPVIRLSEYHGGLIPSKRGGGMQSKSLRLEDKEGKEWVIRSVEKTPDLLLPPELRETFARDWIDDALSAQHPFSALSVPPLAQAAGVPHAKPVIGVIAPDKNLGIYEKDFVNKVVLLEEREPAGESDNTFKMLGKLQKDNEQTYDAENFLRARLLDLLIGDWDRHEDQWRWAERKEEDRKVYLGVPRDRDQVFRIADGLFPRIAKLRWIAPTLQGFEGQINDVRYSLFKTRFVNALPASQLPYERWNQIVREFVTAMTDSVLEEALKRLPAPSYQMKHDRLLTALKTRRANIPAAMDEYYRFINKIADVRLSDKNERIEIKEGPDRALLLTITGTGKSGEAADTLVSKSYDPKITREVRVYTGQGNDDATIALSNSPVKVRLIAEEGRKTIAVGQTDKRVQIYARPGGATITGDRNRFNAHIHTDSLNTAFVPVNPYNTTMPLLNAALNLDDGFLLGLGFKHIQREGFRKLPYANTQQLMLTRSFSTQAFSIDYKGEWVHALGSADLLLSTAINAPDNTRNFFGRGNETHLDKTGDFKRYYRARFNTYLLDPSLRWRNEKGGSFSIGPSFQYYTADPADNRGRVTMNSSIIGSYDSLSIWKSKAHAGLVLQLSSDRRNNPMLPAWGTNVSIRIQGYTGLNGYSKSYIQILPEASLYKSLNSKSTIVLAERIGGGVSFGKTAFYQALFLGGQGNLMGFRQYRFAGQHMLYNNLETRIKLTDLASYILPGQFGFLAFYDLGRVWEKGEKSNNWHHGTGAGLYFAPAQVTVFRLVAGYSKEGWYPSAAMKFRF